MQSSHGKFTSQTKNVGLVFQVKKMEERVPPPNRLKRLRAPLKLEVLLELPTSLACLEWGNFFSSRSKSLWRNVGALRKSWECTPEVTRKKIGDTSDTSPHYHWKKTTQQKKTAFVEICQRPLGVFSSHSLVEKKLRPLRGLTIVPVWAATHGSVLLEIFNEGSTPILGRKMPWKNSMEAFTIGGYISCWACCLGK